MADVALSTVSVKICQDGHANALALNKDCKQIAVAGRSLLKVYSIKSDGFHEEYNMRCGKNQNLSYSSNDVAWSFLDNNILATAATNGVVSIWDLSKFGRQKQLLVYNEHERTAHTVTFHSTEPNILISGSQDGTIKCFDIRSEKSVSTYFSNSESVRDIKFSPHTSNIFAAVSENGTVQLWDLRKWDKCILQFTAHSGPIYTCDWHSTKNWLATGSRDKQIKVWNMDGKASLEHTVHTIAVVGRVKWRPERTYHIASCALVVDYSIHVWDIRRPYIPFASFNDHTNVTTGIAWKDGDSHCLLSTSKDSTIYRHAFKDAVRPSFKANPQSASLSRYSDVSFANKIKVVIPSTSTSSQLIKNNSSKQKGVPVSDQFHMAQSDFCQFLLKPTSQGFAESGNVTLIKEHESFIGCAKELILNGKELVDICDHNANICKKYGKHFAITLWAFLKELYGYNKFRNHKMEHRFSKQKNAQGLRRPLQEINHLHHESHIWEDTELNLVNTKLKKKSSDLKNIDALTVVGAAVSSANKPNYSCCSVIISEIQVINDITFENFDLLRNGFIYLGPPDFSKVLSFPETALHHYVPQLNIKSENSRERSPPPRTSNILKVSTLPPIPIWEPHQFVVESLLLQSDIGDTQTALCAIIALGELRKLLHMDDAVIEYWFHSYIDLLHRYQLWNEACIIANLSWIRSVRELNEHSTLVHTNCGLCTRPMTGCYCGKCKSTTSSKCCVCGLVVRGLYAWCQGCSHGGHLDHFIEYFSNHSKCPKCGHLCDYN